MGMISKFKHITVCINITNMLKDNFCDCRPKNYLLAKLTFLDLKKIVCTDTIKLFNFVYIIIFGAQKKLFYTIKYYTLHSFFQHIWGYLNALFTYIHYVKITSWRARLYYTNIHLYNLFIYKY